MDTLECEFKINMLEESGAISEADALEYRNRLANYVVGEDTGKIRDLAEALGEKLNEVA